ncbi:MAG: LytTR family DNA-binding domain-containing protein [Lachnospiraceae bacterium]|nr:LytTR family DNA-binding domain-containing protein [Lachnospiraceae bacterium]
MKIAICDDEKEIRDYLHRLIMRYYEKSGEESGISSDDRSRLQIGLFESGQELLTSAFQAEIIFLDVEMPAPDGMETAKRLRMEGNRAVIIFVTALKEYVFDAFDVGAFHYIVKPFREEKFFEVLGKAIRLWKEQEDSIGEREAENVLDVRNGKLHTVVLIRNILYAEVFDREIILHVMDESSATAESTVRYYGRISALEKTLGSCFYRIHRSFLVNMDHINSYEAGHVFLREHDLPIARGKYPDFVKAYMRLLVNARSL